MGNSFFDPTRPTGKKLEDLLPKALAKIQTLCKDRPDLVVNAWAAIVGEKIAPLATAVSFQEGVLHVVVKNSTLLSLLSVNEKTRLLQLLRAQFPQVQIRSIRFRIG